MSDETLTDRLRRINARQPPEHDLRLRAAALVAVMAAVAAVLAQQVGSPALQLAALVGIPAAYVYSYLTRRRPGYVTKLFVAAGAVLALAWFLHTLSGITGGTVADAQTPLAELLLAVQAVQAFDLAARRDILFSLFISVVVMAAAGILSVSMALLPYLAVWAVAATTALVLAHGNAQRELPSLAQSAAPAPWAAGERSRRGGVARPIAVALVGAVVLGLGAFFILPPAGTARALVFPAQLRNLVPVATPGGLENPSLGSADPGFQAEARAGRRVARRSTFGYLGFSTTLDLAARARPDDTLVMRVRAQFPAFWRAQTFDRWDGQVWTMSSQRSFPIVGSLPLEIPPAPGEGEAVTGPDFVQTYYVVQPGPNLVFGAAPITQLYLSDHRVRELADGTLRTPVELGPGAVYTVVSRPPLVTADSLRRADRDPAGAPSSVTQHYARPLPTTARVRQLARRLTAGAPTTYDKITALEAWMGAHTRYTLNIPPLPSGVDAVDQYLFVDRRGFCEQIATSLVVMLRSLGVPARLAVGYAPGLRNPFTGLFEVRASDAHAWAEVWFPGVGWEPFDPTASVPLAGDAGSASAASGLFTYLSAVLPSLPPHSLPVAGGLAGAGLAGAGLLRLRRSRAAARLRPRPTWAEQCQVRLDQTGRRLGRARSPSETLVEYVGALRAGWDLPGELEHAAALIERAAFSDLELTDEQMRWTERVLELSAPPGSP